MEITFSRVSNYSFVLDEADRKSLAKELGLKKKQFDRLVEDGELLDNHWDGVQGWLSNQTVEPDLIDQDDIEDLEVHA